jgi:hypothetical protein
MLRIVKNQKGSALVFAALTMTAMVGFAALSIDTGVILTADHQLQNAVDAAALAGASGLLINQSTATGRALAVGALNSCLNQPVALNAGNVSYPVGNRIRVQANRPVNLFMARAFGVNTATVNAAAMAELGALSETKKLRPWCIPFENWSIGSQVVLKEGAHSSCDGGSSSYYYAVNYPPVNKGTPVTGSDVYRDYIDFSYVGEVAIGDVLQVEPGNKNGPTQQGVNYLISQDPGAYWDNAQKAIVNSNFPGSSSPRVLKVPFFDPDNPPANGRSAVTVAGLGAFFLEGVGSDGEVLGRFIKITTEGTNKAGPGAGYLYKVKLLQ